MVNRLVVTGLPCPAVAWESFLGRVPGQKIVTMREVFENSASSDPRDLSLYITDLIQTLKPESIVCHGMGVPLTLLSLLRLERKGVSVQSKVTVFNGPFRKVKLGKRNPTLKIQWTPVKKIIREIRANGGEIDWELKPHLRKIKSMYRNVLMYRLTEKMTGFLGMDHFTGIPKRSGRKMALQVIASKNDPFLNLESMKQISRDFHTDRFITVEYGHYPYSGHRNDLRALVEEFERNPQ
jgi:predicted alpha/beta hydrolase family esterase